MSKQTKKGNRKRHRCSYCNEEHHNSRDYRECRLRGGAPPPQTRESAESHAGSETTLYETNPLRGNKRENAIARKHRGGWPPRKIAKYFGVSLDEVESVLEKLR